MASSTVVSASGKVLLAGGYLVLDPAYSGIVVSTSSRFYTCISGQGPSANHIRVRSPQFFDATWNYAVAFTETGVLVEQMIDKVAPVSANNFVHLALQCTLSLACEVKGVTTVQEVLSKGLDIPIVGDNDFYSQRAKLESLKLPRTLSSLSLIPPFNHTNVRLLEVHKTGLGSSAALITSLVAALLLHFSVIPRETFAEVQCHGRKLAHNLAQYVHCLAQGKVGSGFDVSSAVFGSQLYTRFDPAVLHGLMNDDEVRKGPLLPIMSPSNKEWNYCVEPFKLPPLTRLMLADVDAGSDTPSLVGKVLKWREESAEEALILWTTLDVANHALSRTLLALSELHDKDPEVYASAVKYISTLQPLQWLANPSIPENEKHIVMTFYEAHGISESIRANMRKMGNASDVPIEPIEQTNLLNACVCQAGVIGGGVPGAGGYDAVWLLVTDPHDCPPEQRPLHRVEHVWSTWKDLDVSPLSAMESGAKGARLEMIDEIPGLKEAISEKK